MKDTAVEIAVVMLVRGEKVWMQLRQATGHLDGYWEFPGGKIEPDETAAQCAIREFVEETGIVLPGNRLESMATTEFDYPDRKVRIHFYFVEAAGDLPQDGRWFGGRELEDVQIPPANRGVLDLLKRRLEGEP